MNRKNSIEDVSNPMGSSSQEPSSPQKPPLLPTPTSISDVKVSDDVENWSVLYGEEELKLGKLMRGNKLSRIEFGGYVFERRANMKGNASGSISWNLSENDRRLSFKCSGHRLLSGTGKRCPARIDRVTYENGLQKYRILNRDHSSACKEQKNKLQSERRQAIADASSNCYHFGVNGSVMFHSNGNPQIPIPLSQKPRKRKPKRKPRTKRKEKKKKKKSEEFETTKSSSNEQKPSIIQPPPQTAPKLSTPVFASLPSSNMNMYGRNIVNDQTHQLPQTNPTTNLLLPPQNFPIQYPFMKGTNQMTLNKTNNNLNSRLQQMQFLPRIVPPPPSYYHSTYRNTIPPLVQLPISISEKSQEIPESRGTKRQREQVQPQEHFFDNIQPPQKKRKLLVSNERQEEEEVENIENVYIPRLGSIRLLSEHERRFIEPRIFEEEDDDDIGQVVPEIMGIDSPPPLQPDGTVYSYDEPEYDHDIVEKLLVLEQMETMNNNNENRGVGHMDRNLE